MKAAVKFGIFGKRKPGVVGGPNWWQDEREDAREEETGGPHPREILLPETVVEALVEKPEAVLAAALDHARFLLTDGLYLADEISPEARRSAEVDLYVREVEAGGHKRYVASSGWDETAIRACNEGLNHMGAAEYAVLFQSLIRYMDEDPLRAELLRQGSGFGNLDTGLVELDKAFFALGGAKALLGPHVEWLLARPDVRVVPDRDMEWERQRLIAINPNRAQRINGAM